MPKAPSVSLTKMIEATKLQPRTGLPLGVPPVTVPFGALVEPVGAERDRQRFNYLGDLFECKLDLFLSATGGGKGSSKKDEESEQVTARAVETAEPPADSSPRLEWEHLSSAKHPATRAAIPGGWLVALEGSGVTFVPDAKHMWDGGSVE